MTSHTHIDLTQGAVSGHLVRMAVPMIWGILSVVSMQLMDVYFISGLGQTQLEAISFTFPVNMVLFNLVMGLSIATSSISARLIGARDMDNLKQFIAHSLIMGALTGVVLGAMGEILMVPVFHMLGAQEAHLAFILPFMRISLWGYTFMGLVLVANAALRALGDTAVQSGVMILAAAVNIPLSWILVYGHGGVPTMGTAGAAAANITSYAIAAIVAISILIFRRRLIDRAHLTVRGFGSSWRRMMVIALPVGLVNLAPAAASLVVTALLATSGAAAVAAYGIIGRIEGFAAVILMAVAIAVGPLVGQNYGAGRMDRVQDTIHAGLRFCMIWAVFVGIVLMIFAGPITRLFTHEVQMVHIVQIYFLTAGMAVGVGNIVIAWASAWNAMGHPRYGALMNVVRSGGAVILCGFIGHALYGWMGIFIGMMVGNIAAAMGLHLWSVQTLSRLTRSKMLLHD